MKLVNRSDIFDGKEGFWKHNYIVSLAGTDFGVNADCESDALDEVMDYISSHRGYKGLYSKNSKRAMDNPDSIIAGNYGYHFTVPSYEIRIESVTNAVLRTPKPKVV